MPLVKVDGIRIRLGLCRVNRVNRGRSVSVVRPVAKHAHKGGTHNTAKAVVPAFLVKRVNLVNRPWVATIFWTKQTTPIFTKRWGICMVIPALNC